MDPEGYTAESIVLAVSPKVPALMSIWGSVFIVRSVLTTREKKNSIYQRLMLGLSFSDILASHIYFLGTWLIPKGSSGPFGDVYMAFGTRDTCTYSGFFNQLAVASPLYNVSLSIYYMLRIQRGWRDKALAKIEPLFHIVPITFAFGTSITAAIGEMYGNVFWTCWINPDPPQPNFRYFQWAFLFGPVWVCIIIQFIVMMTLWWTMRKQERLISKKYALEEPAKSSTDEGKNPSSVDSVDLSRQSDFSIETNDATKAKKSKRKRTINEEGKYSSRIAVQGSLYVLAFMITWLFPTVQRITELANGTNYFAVQALDTTLLPLQGFFNVLIYLRPKYLHYRRKYPDLPSVIIWKMLRRQKDELKLARSFRRKKETQSKPLQQTTTNNNNKQPPDSKDIEKGTLGSIPEEVAAGDPVKVSVASHNVMKDSNDDDDETTTYSGKDNGQTKSTSEESMEFSGHKNRIQELEERLRQLEEENKELELEEKIQQLEERNSELRERSSGRSIARQRNSGRSIVGLTSSGRSIVRQQEEEDRKEFEEGTSIRQQVEEENTELQAMLPNSKTVDRQTSSDSYSSSSSGDYDEEKDETDYDSGDQSEEEQDGEQEDESQPTAKRIDMVGRISLSRSADVNELEPT